MDNLSWGNPLAHRVRVHFNTASAVIYEGMPVCYNYDTTVNWAGGSVSDGAVTASTSLTAGTPETAAAKYLEVENPSTTNLQWFAGVVAKGGWCGKTVSATAGVGLLLDIYVPNGAIVPVRAGVSCTEGRTILAIQDASQSLEMPCISSNYTSRPVAIAEETIDRTTDGLLLAKLDPNLFICQDMAGTYPSENLIVSTTGTSYSALNRINVTDAFSAGSFCAFEIKSTHTGGAAASMGLGFMVKTVINTTGPTARSCAAGIQLRIDSGTISTEVSALRVYLRETAATWSLAGSYAASVLNLVCQVATNVTANKLCYILVECDGAQIPDHFISVPITGDIGDVACAIGGTVTFNTHDRMIPIWIGSQTYYIPALETNS